jgi:hypothetical protein
MKLFVKAFDTFSVCQLSMPSLEITTSAIKQYSTKYQDSCFINAFTYSSVRSMCGIVCPVHSSLSYDDANLVSQAMFKLRVFTQLNHRALCQSCPYRSKCKCYIKKPDKSAVALLEDVLYCLYGFNYIACNKREQHTQYIISSIPSYKWVSLSNIAAMLNILPGLDDESIDALKQINLAQDRNKIISEKSTIKEKDYFNVTLDALRHCKNHKQKITELKTLVLKCNQNQIIPSKDDKKIPEPPKAAAPEPGMSPKDKKKSIHMINKIVAKSSQPKVLNFSWKHKS